MQPPGASDPNWLAKGLEHIWLPYSQMKLAACPLAVQSTAGSRIRLTDGRELIDGIASWWTSCHGYNHLHIISALSDQMRLMPHIMLGGLAHEPAYRLASRLSAILPGDLERVFFSESGSVAVEVAIKIAIQYRLNRGEYCRTKILSFKGAYHGDTLGTMAVCDPDEGMHSLFGKILPAHHSIDLPRCAETTMALRQFLSGHAQCMTAILVEPCIQGAGGMLFHDAEVLKTLRSIADEFDLLLIFDEVFTGFGRTGDMFACSGAEVTPDIITLSKALTGGVLPLAATVARKFVFDSFWSDNQQHALMHGPTFMGNALACAAANASLDLFETEPRLEQTRKISEGLTEGLISCRDLPGVVDVRIKGAVGVVEFDGHLDQQKLQFLFSENGIWVRPLGRIVYLTPALTIPESELEFLTTNVCGVLRGYPHASGGTNKHRPIG